MTSLDEPEAPNLTGEKRAERDERGRLLPGHSVGVETRLTGAPGPGRPPKDAWLRELEAQLEAEPEKAKAMAREVYRICTEGEDDKVRLAALKEIQDRIGGPVVREVKTEVTIVPHTIELKARNRPEPPEIEGAGKVDG